MTNLPATFPLDSNRIGSAYELPVLVDLAWYGQTMTSDNSGIIPSRAACRESLTPFRSTERNSDEVVL